MVTKKATQDDSAAPVDNGLSVEPAEGGLYCLMKHGTPVLTGMGGLHPVKHSNSEFLRQMAEQLNERGTLIFDHGHVAGPQGFDFYSLFSLQKDWVEPQKDNFSVKDDFVGSLICDQILAGSLLKPIRTAGGAVDEWLRKLGARIVDLDYVDLSNVPGVPDGWIVERYYGDDDGKDFQVLVEALRSVFEGLTVEQKSAAVYLSNIADNSVVFSLCLASDNCTPSDFAKWFMSRYGTVDPASRRFKAELKRVEKAASRASGQVGY